MSTPSLSISSLFFGKVISDIVKSNEITMDVGSSYVKVTTDSKHGRDTFLFYEI